MVNSLNSVGARSGSPLLVDAVNATPKSAARTTILRSFSLFSRIGFLPPANLDVGSGAPLARRSSGTKWGSGTKVGSPTQLGTTPQHLWDDAPTSGRNGKGDFESVLRPGPSTSVALVVGVRRMLSTDRKRGRVNPWAGLRSEARACCER